MPLEIRTFPAEMRSAEDGKISGYAAVFNSLSVDMWGFREKIAPGAFSDTLADPANDPIAFWNHNYDMPMARKSAGTLELSEDAHGLAYVITPDGTDWSRNAVESIRKGTTKGTSFGFLTLDDQWDEDADGVLIRTLKRVKLYEISPTPMPAYPATEAQVRALFTERKKELSNRHAAPPAIAGGVSLGLLRRRLDLESVR